MEAAELDWAMAPEDIINGAKSPEYDSEKMGAHYFPF
jgi:hypothetical protein